MLATTLALSAPQTIGYTAEPEEPVPQPVQIEIEYTEEYIIELIQETFPEDPHTALAIAKCESNLKPDAYNPKSNDGGLMQINQVHLPELNKLGLDRFNVEDNLTFARMLYERRGWQPWVCADMI